MGIGFKVAFAKLKKPTFTRAALKTPRDEWVESVFNPEENSKYVSLGCLGLE